MADFATLGEAKEYVMKHKDTGVQCPCCDKFVKLYKRKLNTGMALFLMWLYKLGGKHDYIQAGEILSQGMKGTKSLDYSVLAHWGLIKDSVNDDDTKKGSGFWKLTDRGIRFVEKEISVFSHIYLYNNIFFGYGEDTVNIVQALGSKFDYQELMK